MSAHAWSENDLYLARHIAAAVPGVKAVGSEMELVRGGSKGRW